MNQDELQALGERAVKCKGWRWMPGMVTRTTNGGGFPYAPAGTLWRFGEESERELRDLVAEGMVGCGCSQDCRAWSGDCSARNLAPPRPLLNDHATLGCLLALVQEAWGPQWCIKLISNPDAVVCVHRETIEDRVFTAEDGGLVAALEAAP